MNGKINWICVQPLIGGMSIGFENAFNTLPLAIITSGIKNDYHYINYMNNIRKLNIPIIYMNSTYDQFQTINDEKIYGKIISNNEIDVLMHVAICAGLSMLNTCNTGNKARGDANNDQNQNMYNLTTLGMKLNANVVVFENAPTAYTKSGENVINKLKEIANIYNYSTHLLKTDTLLHGIPQSRKRTFISFYKNSNPPIFNYELKKYIQLSEYLNLIDKNSKHYDEYICEKINDIFYEFILNYSNSQTYFEAVKKIGPHKNTWTSLQLSQYIGFDKTIEYFEKMFKKTTDKKYQIGIKISKHCLNKINNGKGYWDGSTYIANNRLYINALISKNAHRALHPIFERGFNIREMLWLMGHPDNFELIDSKKLWYHVSQNVPVKTAEYIGNQLKLYLENKLEESNTNFVKQDNIKQKIDIGSIKIKNW